MNIKLPEAWLKRAQRLADESNKRAIIGKLTRADILRAALSLGLSELEKLERQVAPMHDGFRPQPGQTRGHLSAREARVERASKK